jgi:Domain of unknown function (DUF1995)
MSQLPKNLEESIVLAQTASKQAIAAGWQRFTVELLLPDINNIPELRGVDIAETFLAPFNEEYGNTLKVFLPDTGAAALARRNWTWANFKISDLGSSRSPVTEKIQDEDRLLIAIEPSSVEIEQIEKLCNAAGDRPVLLFLPRLEDSAIVGIGYAARQLRDRFLKNLQTAYYIKPLADAAIYRCYPHPWQVWREEAEDYTLLAELPEKPVGDELDAILMPSTTPDASGKGPTTAKTPGVLAGLGRFIRALSR